MRKTTLLEISDTLVVVPLTVALGSRKTAVLEILDTLVVRFSKGLASAEDLTAAVATRTKYCGRAKCSHTALL